VKNWPENKYFPQRPAHKSDPAEKYKSRMSDISTSDNAKWAKTSVNSH